MPSYTDALRGYGHRTHERDGFRCRYCGLDGSTWPNWLSLSIDHLLPKGHPLRDDEDYIVTACMFCNTADNHFFEHAAKRRLQFDDMTPEQLVDQRRPYVQKVRDQYREFWESNVHRRL